MIERYDTFTVLISSVNRYIKKIKTEKTEVKIKRADIKLPDNFDFSSIKR